MKSHNRHRTSGFSLLEVMAVVAIVAILTAVSVPIYTRYVMESRRTDATTTLLRIQSVQEKFYLNNNRYSADLATLNIAGTDNGYYDVVVASADPVVGFTATATPAAGSPQLNDDDCQSFTITNQGVRTATDSGGADNSDECW